MKFAYADPPYPGMAYKYKDHPDYAGEVDHKILIERLLDKYPDGWALSTHPISLREVLYLCPNDARVLIWAKSSARPPYYWEPVIRYGGRSTDNSGKDYIVCPDDPKGDKFRRKWFLGEKPEVFCFWLFRCLGARPGDILDDLFPGSGAVGRAWEKYVCQLSYLDNEGERHLKRGRPVALPGFD